MLTTIPIVTVILLVALLSFAATRPDTFRIERTTRIQAPPEQIFTLLIDFRRWGEWSPYEKLEPAMKRTYSGEASGKGAVYEWAGKGKAGEGRMEITGVSPSSRVTIQLDFFKPFACRTFTAFALDADHGLTNVRWAMYGPQSYLAKVMTMFFSRDRLVGKDLERGLANLKTVIETTKQRSAVCN